MQWLDALEAILRTNGLWYKEYESYIQVISGQPQQQQQVTVKEEKPALPAGAPTLDSREVSIQAVFFEADLTKLNSRGININYVIQGTWNNFSALGGAGGITTPNAMINAGATVTQGIPSVNGDLNVGGAYNVNNFGTLSALFGLLESENLGKILASPNVTVRSGEEGNVQVGVNFFVTNKDFAGNTVQQMQNAGIIMRAVPTVFTQDSIDFISLELDLQNSSLGGSQQTGQIVNTEQARTKVLLLNGEQTTIGGLYSSNVSSLREGIPVLKDLPWWVFGIKYLTGSDNTTVQNKELIILMRATILPTLKERYDQLSKSGPPPMKSFQQQLQDLDQKIKQYDSESGK